MELINTTPSLYSFRIAQSIAYELAYDDDWKYEVEPAGDGLYKIGVYDSDNEKTFIGYWYE